MLFIFLILALVSAEPEFLTMNSFGMHMYYPLGKCVASQGTSSDMKYSTETTVKACNYENEDCSGEGKCQDVTLMEMSLKYASEVEENIAHAKVATDEECKKMMEAVTVTFSNKCMSIVDLFGDLFEDDDPAVPEDEDQTVKKEPTPEDNPYENLHLKFSVEENELKMGMFMEKACGKSFMSVKIADCDKCIGTDDFANNIYNLFGGDDDDDITNVKKMFHKKNQLLKKEGEEDNENNNGNPFDFSYMSVICEAYDGVSSTLILFMIACKLSSIK